MIVLDERKKKVELKFCALEKWLLINIEWIVKGAGFVMNRIFRSLF